MSSKKDVYNFLTQECEAYLPKIDTVNIFFLKQITRGAKEVRQLIANHVVHQEVGSQGGLGAPDRGADSGGLPHPREEETCSPQVPPRRAGLAPPGQEVGLRRPLHPGHVGCPRHDHQGDG